MKKKKKSTELPTPQKNKLTINLKYPDSNENNKKDINHNAKSPIVYQRELKVIHEKPKTINRYYNNSIEIVLNKISNMPEKAIIIMKQVCQNYDKFDYHYYQEDFLKIFN